MSRRKRKRKKGPNIQWTKPGSPKKLNKHLNMVTAKRLRRLGICLPPSEVQNLENKLGRKPTYKELKSLEESMCYHTQDGEVLKCITPNCWHNQIPDKCDICKNYKDKEVEKTSSGVPTKTLNGLVIDIVRTTVMSLFDVSAEDLEHWYSEQGEDFQRAIGAVRSTLLKAINESVG